MSATLHQLSPASLRVALLPGGGAHVEAIVRAYLPAPVRLATGPARPDTDLALVWWGGPATRVDRAQAGAAPLVALCAGGPDVLAAALGAGADYALALPVTPDLLRAVCTACTRRGARTPTLLAPPLPVLTLDGRARTLRAHGRPVDLTLREFDLLAYLVENAGAAVTRDEILRHVWGIDFETGTNTVDVFIYAIRQKLRASGLRAAIETVRGVGYRLDPALT